MKTLDPEAVQAFVLVADLKSFTRAAEALDTTQSAVSLKIKRLEDGLGRRLLERTPRHVRLSADGGAFLDAARALVAANETAMSAFEVAPERRLRVGLSHHVVGAELPVLLKRLSASDPALVMEMHVATCRDLLDAFDRHDLDAVIVLRNDSLRRDGTPVMEEAFGWMASPDFRYQPGTPLRLAAQAESCGVRGMAIEALEAAGVPWREVFTGGGIATLSAAVMAGLAVAALGRRVAPPGSIDIGPGAGLPPLPARDILLHSDVHSPWAKAALRALTAAIRSTA